MEPKFFLTAGLLAGLAGAAQAPAGNHHPVDLRFNFRPASRFSYTVQVLRVSDIQTAPAVRVSDDNTLSTNFLVQAGTGANKNLRLTCDWLASKRTVGSQATQVYDSRDPATRTSTLAASIAGLVGQSLTVGLTSQGEIQSIKGVESLNQHILAGMPRVTTQLPSQSENTIRSSLNHLFNFYPGHAVQPGESWTKAVVLNLETDTMHLTSTYTLGSVQHGAAHLRVSGQLTASGEAGRYTGTERGTLDVDVATGLVMRGQLHRAMTGRTGKYPMKSSTDVTTTGKQLTSR